MNNNVYVSYDEMHKSLNNLNQELLLIDETCKKIKQSFNNLRNADMKGKTAEVLLRIYDKWENINENRLQEIEEVRNLLNFSLNEYEKAFNEIESKVIGGNNEGNSIK